MRPPRPARIGGGPSARRRGGEVGAAEPALERPRGRQRALGELVAQHHADQSGPPGRMLPPQVEGGSDERIGGLGCRRPAPVIRRGQGGRIAVTEAVEQAADRARGQVEGAGDGGAILAILIATPDGLA